MPTPPAPAAGVIEQLTVRRATVADLDAVIAVASDTYREHFAHIWTAAGIEAYLARELDRAVFVDEVSADRSRWLLAERGGATLGYAKLRFPRPLPHDPARSGLELQKLYMRDTGNGVGARLLDEVVAQARELGFEVLWLDVLVQNPRARAFYERHGFVVVGADEVITDLGREPLLVMARAP